MTKTNMTIQSVGVFTEIENATVLLDELQSWWQQHGIVLQVLKRDTVLEQPLDLLLVLGGDGSVLYALKQFAGSPVMGINYGHIGFLTAGHRDELHRLLESVIAKEFVISERMMLECRYPGGTGEALNEMVIRGATRMISVDLKVDGTPIRCIRGDGVIVGTPTGSTAYLLSAGSPIVMPTVRCMVLCGLNEYNFTARHLILDHDADVRLSINEATREQDIYLSVDGGEKTPLTLGDEIQIQRSQQQAKLIFMEKGFFFSNLSSRLSWL